MSELIYKEEAYEIVGICMEVHNELGPGLLEIIYKEAIELETDSRFIQYEGKKNITCIIKITCFGENLMQILSCTIRSF